MIGINSTLGEICQKNGGLIQTGPFGSQLHQTDYTETGVPVVMPKDIVDGKISVDGVARIPETKAQQLSRHLLRQNSIVMPRRGDISKRAYIKEDQAGFFCGSGCLQIITPDHLLDARYLYYYLAQDQVVEWLERNAIGTTMLNLSMKIVENIPFCLIPLITQKKIASILSNYDDLIENNRRRIQLLERSLHLLYKEWFVHLRFPSHEHSKIVDGIPEGWKNKKITELSVVIDGTHDSPKPTDNGYYMVTGRHIINGFIDFSKCYFISEEDHRQVMQRSKPEKGDIIFSNIGTLGSTVLVDQDFEFSIKNLALFKPHKKIYSNYLYGFFSDPRRIEDLNNQSSGTSQKFFSLKFLRSLSILTPPLPILEYFDDLAQPILKQRSLLHYENIKLQQARDLLLPKLMSGALGV